MVAAVAALVGLIIERFGLRPLQNSVRIAPLLATIGISFVLDQIVMLTFSPNPRALPSQLPDIRFQIGDGNDRSARHLLIACIGVTSAAAAVCLPALHQARLGGARHGAGPRRRHADGRRCQPRQPDSVRHCRRAWRPVRHAGRHVLQPDRYGDEPPRDAEGCRRGGGRRRGNVPGAVVGSLLLGLVESYGVAVFGTSYRNLFAFLLLIVVLVLRPNGLFASAEQAPPEPMTGTFIAPSRPVHMPRWALLVAFAAFALLPLLPVSSYVLQTLINAWLFAMLALSLTLVAGTIGQVSLGHAALLAIGAYTSALLSLDFVRAGQRVHRLRRADERGARHASDLAVVPSARALCLDRDTGDRRDHIAGHPELGNRHARTDRGFGYPAAVAIWF